MTRYPSIKRRLRKLYLRKRGGHAHPAYDKCSEACKKSINQLEGEILDLEARRDKINGIKPKIEAAI